MGILLKKLLEKQSPEEIEKKEETAMKILENSGNNLEWLKNEKFKNFNFYELKSTKSEEIMVNTSKIVGTSRFYNAINWYEYIKDLHKRKTVSDLVHSDRESLKNYLENPKLDLNPNIISIPELFCINDEYYIGDGGKHRITIGKCLKIEKIYALVHYY